MSLSIAQTIISQIKATVGTNSLLCWGFRSPKAFGEKSFGENFGGVFFQVSGLLFKGKVMVKLAYNDTYTVEFGTLRKGEWKAKKVIEDVYCDQLGEIIDDNVEGYFKNKDKAVNSYKNLYSI